MQENESEEMNQWIYLEGWSWFGAIVVLHWRVVVSGWIVVNKSRRIMLRWRKHRTWRHTKLRVEIRHRGGDHRRKSTTWWQPLVQCVILLRQHVRFTTVSFTPLRVVIGSAVVILVPLQNQRLKRSICVIRNLQTLFNSSLDIRLPFPVMAALVLNAWFRVVGV